MSSTSRLRASACVKAACHARPANLLRLALALSLAACALPRAAFAHARSSAEEDEARLAQFEQGLDALRRRYGIPGLSAAIVSNGQIVWSRGLGFQDVENRIPAAPDTPYRIASLTKTFASTILMRCVERDALNLDTQISFYTSAVPTHGITVRHLFTHTSESSPPGEAYSYNGNRFAALTPVADACSGRPFRETLAKTILDPLGMSDSVPGQDLESPSPASAALFAPETLARYQTTLRRLAKPYRLDSAGRAVLSSYPNRGISASAGLVSTVRDLALYDAAIDRHTLLRAETQAQAWTNHVNRKGKALPYALGWFAQSVGRERVVWHYGYWPNSFSSLILKVPARRLTLILLANSDGLSSPFPLGGGNVKSSAFASLFLKMLADPKAFKGTPSGTAELEVKGSLSLVTLRVGRSI